MNQMDSESVSEQILSQEKIASDCWNKGDGSGFLELYRDDVTFADVFNTRILYGKAEVEAYFKASLRGVVIEKAEWSNERVAVDDAGDTAILTYNQQNYIRSKKDGRLHKVPLWHCVEVYRLTCGEWKIAHANWSLAQHPAVMESFQHLFSDLGY